MLEKIRTGGIEAAFDAGKLVQPAALFYSSPIGLGFGRESNGLRQTSLISARPCVAAVLLCPVLAPRDFGSAEELAKAVIAALVEGHAKLERRYKAWPVEDEGQQLPPVMPLWRR